MKHFLLAAITTTLFVCCNKQTEIPENEGTYEVQLRSSLETRATDQTWESGDAIGVYAVEAGTQNVIGNANSKFVTSSNSSVADFVPATDNDYIYYPHSGNIDILVYYPYLENLYPLEYPLDVTDQSNQSEIDLMSAKEGEIAKSDSAIDLVFIHKLTKVTVNLVAATDGGITDEELSKAAVTMSGSIAKANFNLQTEEVDFDGNTAEDITTTANSGVASAIVIPQNATLKFTITLPYGDSYDVTTNEVTLQGCMSNNYTISVSKTSVSIIVGGATILDWNEVDEGEFSTDSSSGDETLSSDFLSENTQMANQLNNGYATADEESIFFYSYDDEGVKLYRENRATGELTILDAISNEGNPGGGDQIYTNLIIVGDYLYYIPFNYLDKIDESNRICRMKKDGTDKSVITSDKVYQYQVYNNKIYYTTATGSALYSIDLDGTNAQTALSSVSPTDPWLRDGKVYYCRYINDNGFKSQLVSCEFEQTQDVELVFENTYFISYAFGADNYLYCLSMESPSLSDLYRITPSTTEAELLLSGIPYGKLNVSGNTIIITCPYGNDNYGIGIYSYQKGDSDIKQIINAATNYISVIGNDQIVYSNNDDQENAGRFWQLYITNLDGSINTKLAE